MEVFTVQIKTLLFLSSAIFSKFYHNLTFSRGFVLKKRYKFYKPYHFCKSSPPQQFSHFVQIKRIVKKSKHKSLIGYAGGSYYTHTGAAVDALCSPRNPEWGNYMDGTDGGRAHIYGAEYETSGLFGKWHNLREHDVPCVVCLVRSRSVVNMFPGTRKSRLFQLIKRHKIF